MLKEETTLPDETSLQHTPDEHSNTVGGSSASRVINCPGSVKALERFPKIDTSSAASETGTMLHNAIAWLLDHEERPDVWTLEGQQFPSGEGSLQTITKADINDSLIPALRAFDRYTELCKHEGGLEFDIETRVQMKGIPNSFGTGDIIGRTARRSVVWDWKFGYNEVDPTSEQLYYYGTAAMMTDETRDLFGLVDPQTGETLPPDDDWPVDLIICQPATGEDPCYRRHTVTVGELKAFRMKLIAAWAEAQNDDARRARGKWCAYQPCKADCPLWLAPLARLGELGEKLNEIEVQAEEAQQDIGEDMSVAALIGHACDIADALEEYARDIKAHAQARLEAGLPVPGRYLAEKASHRKWVDEKKAAGFLRRQGVKDKKLLFTDPKLVSPAQAEKLLKNAGVKLTDKQLKAFADLCPKGPSSGHTMVREDSGRAEVKTTGKLLQELATKIAAS